MANRTDIEELLLQSLRDYDSSLDLTTNSAFYRQVVLPVLDAVGDDPLSTDPELFVKDRLEKEYPLLDVGPGSGMGDLIAKPAALMVGALREQILRVRQQRSVSRPDLLTDADADDLMANWFVDRRQGSKSAVVARVFYANPKYVSVTSVNRFFTASGLNFFPIASQSVTSEQMAMQRVGELYYADISLISEAAGLQYSIEPGDLVGATGIGAYTRVTNLASSTPGGDREDNSELILRARRSLTERSLTNARAHYARLTSIFGGIQQLQVTGYNDPEMQRDIISGSGEGKVYASGKSFVFGTYLVFIPGFEHRGDAEELFVAAGFTLDLHYGRLLYGLSAPQRHERFTVEDVIFQMRDVAPQISNIMVLRIDAAPTPTTTALGGMPGFLPAVGTVITGPGKLTISGIPGGVLRDGLEVDDNEVHIGGHYDVWVRPTQGNSASISLDTLTDEDPLLAGATLRTLGASVTPNVVESTDITLDWVELGVLAGMHLAIDQGVDQGTYRILAVTELQLVLDTDLSSTDSGLNFRVIDELTVDLVEPKDLKIPYGEEVLGVSAETVIGSNLLVLDVNLLAYSVVVGDTIRLLDGDDAGDYIIQGFDSAGGGNTPIVDRPMSDSASGLSYQVFTAFEGIQRPMVRIPPEGMGLLDSSSQPTGITVPYALPVEARAGQTFSGAEALGTGELGFTVPGVGLAFAAAEDACPSDLDTYIANIGAVLDESVRARLLNNQNLYSECLGCDGYIFCVTIDSDGWLINYDLPKAGRDYINALAAWLTQTISAFFPSFVPSTPPIIELSVGSLRINHNRSHPAGTTDVTEPVQFEICVPEELFGCCSNIFLALPDVDVKEFITQLSEFIEAVDDGDFTEEMTRLNNLIDLLPRHGPALCEDGVEAITLLDGPNAGTYKVESVLELSLDITPAATGFGLAYLASLAEGDLFWMRRLLVGIMAYGGDTQYSGNIHNYIESADVADLAALQTVLNSGLTEFKPVLKMCAAVIKGQFPVDAWRPYCESFVQGFPAIPPLPDPPDFDADCYDSYGDAQDPFNILIEFIRWAMDTLEAMGFDVPQDFEITATGLLGGLIESIRVPYATGRDTCKGLMRVYFSEPTSFEVSAGMTCGTSYLGAEQPYTIPAENPTLFSATIGALEILFAATEADIPYHLLPVLEDPRVEVEPKDYPRDLEIAVQGAGPVALSLLQLTDEDRPAPLALGMKPDFDFIEIHEQIYTMASVIVGVAASARVEGVVTRAGSSTISVLGPASLDLRRMLVAGDVIFLEEGLDAGGYIVVSVPTALTVVLDSAPQESTLPVLKSGFTATYDGSGANPSRLTASAGAFDTNDVGRYLTIYAAHYPVSNGSYEVLSVDTVGGAWAELDVPAGTLAAFADSEVRWALTEAPSAAPAEAEAGGTELVALRPARFYKGDPVQFHIVAADSTLDNSTARFTVVSLDDPSLVPPDGVLQPYRITRPDVQRISSTQMANNREGSLYYADIEVRSLGVDAAFNVPNEQRFEAVFGTYRSDGYWYEVGDTNFTFSPEEEVSLKLSGSFLPVGRDDSLFEMVPLHKKAAQIKYDRSSLVESVHGFVTSESERAILANALARHFLPSYICTEIRYFGGDNPSTIAASLDSLIRVMYPEEAISVAHLERLLKDHGVEDWEHDIYLVSVTHDLDRRLVGNRSRDRFGGEATAYFNGSNRTSFFIPGENQSSDVVEDAEDVPVGESIRLVRVSSSTELL